MADNQHFRYINVLPYFKEICGKLKRCFLPDSLMDCKLRVTNEIYQPQMSFNHLHVSMFSVACEHLKLYW